MTPNEITRTIEHCLQTFRPLFISGPPGVGKSALVDQATKRNNLSLIDIRLSQMDSVDMRGLPMILKIRHAGEENGEEHADVYTTRWVAPDFLPKDGRGILFLDELNTAMPAVQTVAYQLTHDRRLGQYVLPPGWLVVAAGNRQKDRAVVNRMSSALASRFLMVSYDCSVDDWTAWAMRNNVEPEIISCIRSQPQLLYNFDPDKWQDGTCFACPRTWHYLDQSIKACPDVFGLGKSAGNTADKELRCWELELVQGIIGPAAGMAFFLHLQHYIKLPTPKEIIADPKGAPVPDNASAKHAVSAALIRATTAKTIAPIMTYMKRIEREFSYYLVRCIMDATKGGNAALVNTPEAMEYYEANKDLFGGENIK